MFMHQLNNFLNGYRGNPDILKIPNCSVESGTKILATDTLTCKVRPSLIGLVCPAHPIDPQFD